MSTAIIIVAAVVVIGSYLIWLAGRLDRLAVRVESARASLDAQLLRRAVAAHGYVALARRQGLAGLEELDLRVSAVLAEQPLEDLVTAQAMAEEEAQQSALTRAIRGVLRASGDRARESGGAEGHGLTDIEAVLRDTCNRVRFARQFHNDTVHATLALRRRRLVRWLRLWGTARPPQYFEIDDALD